MVNEFYVALYVKGYVETEVYALIVYVYANVNFIKTGLPIVVGVIVPPLIFLVLSMFMV